MSDEPESPLILRGPPQGTGVAEFAFYAAAYHQLEPMPRKTGWDGRGRLRLIARLARRIVDTHITGTF